MVSVEFLLAVLRQLQEYMHAGHEGARSLGPCFKTSATTTPDTLANHALIACVEAGRVRRASRVRGGAVRCCAGLWRSGAGRAARLQEYHCTFGGSMDYLQLSSSAGFCQQPRGWPCFCCLN